MARRRPPPLDTRAPISQFGVVDAAKTRIRSADSVRCSRNVVQRFRDFLALFAPVLVRVEVHSDHQRVGRRQRLRAAVIDAATPWVRAVDQGDALEFAEVFINCCA